MEIRNRAIKRLLIRGKIDVFINVESIVDFKTNIINVNILKSYIQELKPIGIVIIDIEVLKIAIRFPKVLLIELFQLCEST